MQVISDLLKPERQNLTIKEDRKRGVFVDGLSEWVVRSPQEVGSLITMHEPCMLKKWNIYAHDVMPGVTSRMPFFKHLIISTCSYAGTCLNRIAWHTIMW